ncbi:concanavalin A-like lectin/glucanase domain-containing protein [Mycena epipterygia]|nr:concanavalin A-like lectin/glucanase domain-containing protein [Mycena epipterygia]
MYTLVVILLSFSAFLLSAEAQMCNATSLCPAAAPCCSEFGYCGTGNQFCLGGCNPFQSHTLSSCQPSPICKSTTYTFNDESRILTNATLNNGDATKYDWIVDGGNVSVGNGELSMLLTEMNNGVRLSSTRFVHYGTITATMKTGRWNGVVAGFITMSNIRDEIDWEFPGAATTEGQTNYFWQGLVTTPNHGGIATGLTDTYESYHDYTIVWSPDSLIFQVNGKTVRTIKQTDTIINGVSQFPNTPSRIQFSLWPAGTSASAPGTIQWSGGLINWNDQDYANAGGHFTASVKSVSVKCGDPAPPGASVQGYVYSGGTLSSPTIAFTDESTLSGNTTAPVIPSASPSSSSSPSSSTGTSTSSVVSSSSSASLGTAATTASLSASLSAASSASTSTSADSSSSISSSAASSSQTSSSTSTTTLGNDANNTTPISSASSSSSSAGSSSQTSMVTSTTTLGNDAISAAPTSMSRGGSFFGNGGMDASSVSLSPSPASASMSTSASLSGTPTVTESTSLSGSGSASASASKTAIPNAAPAVAGEVEVYSLLTAILVGVALL